ncbi:MAG: hypothetical protein ABSG51_12610 [Terracidiphilus sp.]|jgi:repressor LexA
MRAVSNTSPPGIWGTADPAYRKQYTSFVPTKPFTHKQGQYLAFIHFYSRIHGRPPAEADMQRYFRVSPPSVHQMVLTLEANGFIERTPGQGRSIRLLLAREDLPDLE